MKVLVTGGLGFIGSHFIDHLLLNYPGIKIVNLDKRTYAANLDLLDNENVFNIKGDIAEKKDVEYAALNVVGKVDYIVNFAAETHVDNSIENSDKFIKTNIMGVHNILELVRMYRIKKFMQISTDEVYGSIREGEFTEESNYSPNSPYSASKAAAEMLCGSYNKTYNLPIVITRSSNNYGPRQHKEKLIPNALDKFFAGKDIDVYGDGSNEREWIYVTDNCDILMKLLFSNKNEYSIFNVSSGYRITNLELVEKIISIARTFESNESTYRFVVDREGHDFRYAISNERIIKTLKLQDYPHHFFTCLEEGLRRTTEWYHQKEKKC